MPEPPSSNLKGLVRIERLQRVFYWLVGVGIVSILFGISLLGMGQDNPKWWGNVFVAMTSRGWLLWLVIPALTVGLMLLVAAVIVAVVIGKIEKSVLGA